MVAVALAATLIAGCGGDDDGDAETEVTADLARPLQATCGTEGFQKPKTERHFRGDPSGWQILYRVASVDPAAAQAGATTTVLVIEESPELPAEGVTGGHPVTIDGQEVSLRSITEPAPRHVAQWLTSKARYIGISDGATPERLKGLIACLP